jgi:hypothetical protein
MTRAVRIGLTFTAAVIASGIALFCWPMAACLYRRGN